MAFEPEARYLGGSDALRGGIIMKRFIAAIIGAADVSTGAFAQTSIDFSKFQSDLGSFANSMSSALMLNASVGSTWSDAYIGGFPNFGVGVVAGAAFTGKGSVTPLFNDLSAAVPAAIDQFGVPIPAVGLSAKIGLPFLPIDVGLSGGYIPQSVGDQLKGMTRVSVDYKNIAAQVRVDLLRENLLLPDISLGVGVSYQEGTVTTSLGSSETLLSNQTIGTGSSWSVTASAPELSLGWKSTNVDATLQVSKSFLIFRPYAGLGYTMGSSTVTGGVASALSVQNNGSPSTVDDLNAAVAAANASNLYPNFSTAGFTYTTTASTPMFRMYGGLSFEILVLKLDAQVMYVPATQNLGATFMARFQI